MADRDPQSTPDEDVLDVKSRSRSLRVMLDRAGVSKFRESLPPLDPIKYSIELPHTLDVAKYLYRLVTDAQEREVFYRDPRQALVNAGLPDEVEHYELIVELVRSLVRRSEDPNPSEFFVSHTETQTETHQQWNFDSSGRSSETNTGSITGEKVNFSGFGLVAEIYANPDFGVSYFPQQPLVTPELVSRIRARLSPDLVAPEIKK